MERMELDKEFRETIEFLVKENESLREKLGIKEEELKRQLAKIDKIFARESFIIEDESLIPHQFERRLMYWAEALKASVRHEKREVIECLEKKEFDAFQLMEWIGFTTHHHDSIVCKRMALCFVLIEHSGICIKYAKSEDIKRGQRPLRWYKVFLEDLELYRRSIKFED